MPSRKLQLDPEERILAVVPVDLLHQAHEHLLEREVLGLGLPEPHHAHCEAGHQGRLQVGDVEEQVDLELGLGGPLLVDRPGRDGRCRVIASLFAHDRGGSLRDLGQPQMRQGGRQHLISRGLGTLADEVDRGAQHEVAVLFGSAPRHAGSSAACHETSSLSK